MIGLIKVDTRSLDNGLHKESLNVGGWGPCASIV